MHEVMILGNKVTSLTVDELHEEIRAIIAQNRNELILNTNVHGMNMAKRHPWLKEFRNGARIVHCDGAGVMWAAKLLGSSIACRITIHGWMPQLASFCQTNGFSMFFLGAKPGIAELAAQNLLKRSPGLRIAGTQHGYFAKTGAESEKVVQLINKSKPDILIVGFGMPEQELWLKENWRGIDAHVFLAGGGCFDFVSGALPTCPRWLANLGGEWLFRLFTEPKRLFTRYVIGNPKFMFRVILERLGLYRR